MVDKDNIIKFPVKKGGKIADENRRAALSGEGEVSSTSWQDYLDILKEEVSHHRAVHRPPVERGEVILYFLTLFLGFAVVLAFYGLALVGGGR